MSKMPLYRTLILSGAVLGVLAFTGCGSQDQHETLKVQQMNRWNMTRIGILYQLAEQQYKVGDYDKCTDTLKDAFALKANFAPIYILAARVQIEKGNLETASDDLNTAIRIDANDPEPYYLLGVLYQRWQKPEVACDYYNQAWSRKADEARYMLAMVEMEISLGRLDEAQNTLESKLVYFEQSAALRVALARIATLKNDFATASKCYREAVTLMPEDKNLRLSFANSLFCARQFAEASAILEDLKKSAAPADKADILMILGQSYMGGHRFQDARNCFQEIIRDKPEDTLAYLNLGKACVQTGDLGIAAAAARKVLRNDPENVQGMIITALVQQKQKKWNDAGATLAKAAKFAPGDATVLCMQGLNAQETGNRDQANAFFEKALQADPKDAWAAELLGKSKPAAMTPAKSDDAEPVGVAPQTAGSAAAMARLEVSASK